MSKNESILSIEAILNSRPLYAPSDEITDELVITPAHFLIGETFLLPPPIEIPKESNTSLHRVREEQKKMLEHFWYKWSNDYLSTLFPRKKWFKEQDDIKLGQVVLIKEENLPPGRWRMAKVSELIKSADGLIRNVIVELAERNKQKKNENQSKRKTLTRAIQKLCILPSEPFQILKFDDAHEKTEHNENTMKSY